MPALSAHRQLTALLALLSLCLSGVAQARSEVYGAAPIVRLSSNRPAVLVVINERGPFLFVVDTATTNTVLTPALQRRLRAPMLPGPPVDVVSAAGSVRSHYYRIDEIAVAGVIVEGGRAVVMDLPEEEGVAGVLGAEFLSNFKVDLDMPAKRMALYPERAPIHAPNFVRVQGRLTEHGIIVVPARVENTNVSAAFDSGGRHTIANSWLAGATGHYDNAKLRNFQSYVRDAAKQRYMGVTEDFARIQVGPALWSNRNVLISDIRVFDQIGHGTKPIMFIGMDLMAHRRVIIDYEGASLWLKR
jgi:hypothetical protein